jgi:uncharacterized protein YjiS (DUF1127 family)
MAHARRPMGRPAGRGSVGRKMADMTRHAWTLYWTRRAERAAIAVLYALDDRALKDIGLDRSEIESVVVGAAPGERRICWAPADACGVPGCR